MSVTKRSSSKSKPQGVPRSIEARPPLNRNFNAKFAYAVLLLSAIETIPFSPLFIRYGSQTKPPILRFKLTRKSYVVRDE